MKNQFNLEINKPCSENFNQFIVTKNGGFCKSCKKNVIDFTKMNSKEIIHYFKSESNQDTCGKFNSNQLKSYTENIPQRSRYSFLSAISLACLSFFSFNTVQGQTEITTQDTSQNTINKEDKEITVKGKVSDDTGSLPGVSVILQGTMIGTETDFDGYFEFSKKLKKGDVLVFSFVGMKSRKVVITNKNSATNIELKVDMNMSSCVIVGKVAAKKVYTSKK